MDSLQNHGVKSSSKNVVLSSIPCNSLYGMSIFVKASGKIATIGGVVYLNRKFYDLTTHHSIMNSSDRSFAKDGSMMESSAGDQTDSSEFAFDSDDEEDVDTSEIDIHGATVTSQGGSIRAK